MTQALTRVTLDYMEGLRNHRLLFGHVYDMETIIMLQGNGLRYAYFLPGQIVGYERWEQNRYGTKKWTIFVLKTLEPGYLASKIPGVNPGAECLLKISGVGKVKRTLKWFDLIQQYQPNMADIEPDYYRYLEERINNNLTPSMPKKFIKPDVNYAVIAAQTVHQSVINNRQIQQKIRLIKKLIKA